MNKSVFLFSLLLSVALSAQAQFSQFHVGLVSPSGKFADGNERTENLYDGKGFAATGITIGYKHYSPLNVENLSWLFGIEAYYNGLNSDYKDETEDDGWDDITFPVYLNVPVTFGLNYGIPLASSVKLYGEVALGGNFSMPTKFSLADQPGYQDMEITTTPAFGLAYAIEGGLFLNDRYSIALRYNNLGSYKYKYEIDYETASSDKEKYDKALPITNLSICVGILF
jgi:hypothetical protein